VNVLYLTMNPNRASTTVPTEGWFRLLRENGLRPVLISEQAGVFHRWSKRQGIPSYVLPFRPPSKSNPLPYFWRLWRCASVARRHGTQLIHCNEQNVYHFGQYVGRLLRLPVVVSIHFTMQRPFCEWAFGGRRGPQRIIFTSRGNLEACRPGIEGIVSREQWRVIYNGIDLDKYRPDRGLREGFRRRYGIGSSAVIGVACALRSRKQLEHLFNAAQQLEAPDVRIAVAGGPVEEEQDYADDLLRCAKDGFGDRFLYLGHVERLAEFLNGLDAFVNTSQEEACSLSVIQSLACGCPVIGYPSKSVDDQVLPNGGEIVPQDDVHALAEVLRRWIDAPELLKQRRGGARARAEHMFDARKRSAELWNEYQDVVRTAARKPAPV
jgi:glycosyltransferase involved in cell wall biosynthesis